MGFPWRGAEGSERLLPELPKLPNAHFHSFQPLTLPTPTQSTSEERADSEKLFSKSAEERGRHCIECPDPGEGEDGIDI